MPDFPLPTLGASLLLSFRLHARTVVIVGSENPAASRAFSCLESDAHVVLLGRGLDIACEEVRWRIEQGQIEWREVEEEAKLWHSASTADTPGMGDDEAALHSVLSSLPSVSIVCITDTLIPPSSTSNRMARSAASAARLYEIASRIYRIPTNTTDIPFLCDFAFTSTHRFRSVRSGKPTALQVGITTNSKGCRLSSRITREIVARLPKSIGDAVDNVGRLRDKAKAGDMCETSQADASAVFVDKTAPILSRSEEEGYGSLPSTPNEPVPQRLVHSNNTSAADTQTNGGETTVTSIQRRMRWVAQVSEYWPIESLGSLDSKEIDSILTGISTLIPRAIVSEGSAPEALQPCSSPHSIIPLPVPLVTPSRGCISLLGSGPGHPSLLTLATSRALQTADLVLSDKLVPEGVLRTIPKRGWLVWPMGDTINSISDVELRIARKFPGNADLAQDELMRAALEAAQQGKVVVRLKQGDPMLYARASSEIEYFTTHGYPPTVAPGLSSALAAPLAAGIPVTARGVADGITICTGVTKGGRGGRVPAYDRSTTLLVLMGVARLAEISLAMVEDSYPGYLPTCIIERGTMPDQRVVRSTLSGISDAMSDPRVGAQRPPGMMVVGWACLGVAEGVEGVADDAGEGLKDRDLERVRKWLGGERFAIKEGLDETWLSI